MCLTWVDDLPKPRDMVETFGFSTVAMLPKSSGLPSRTLLPILKRPRAHINPPTHKSIDPINSGCCPSQYLVEYCKTPLSFPSLFLVSTSNPYLTFKLHRLNHPTIVSLPLLVL